MNPTIACPPSDRYGLLINGQLPDADVESLVGHLEECPNCMQTVARLNDSTVTNDLRAAATLGEVGKSSQILALMRNLIASRTKAGTESATPSGDVTQTLPAQSPSPSAELHFLAPPQSEDELGRLNGYRILKLLGEGGMGLVLEAEDLRLKRRVALKVMKPEVAAKSQHRQRFLREAQAAAAVEHDHIVPIFQVGEENGVPFIAMPFLKGEPLDARLKRGRLGIPEIIQIGRQTAEGLAAAHNHGLIHRDIKPGNIWLEFSREPLASDPDSALAKGSRLNSFRVKILDFGLARLSSDDNNLTQSGMVLGTPAYMAPEQARGRGVDFRADLWSLGCVLYELSTGRRAFTGRDTMAILTSLALDTPTEPSSINRDVRPALSNLIMKLLEKNPADRPTSAAEVAESLRKMQPAGTVVVATAPLAAELGVWADLDDDATDVVSTPPPPDRRLRLSRAPKRFAVTAIALLFLIGISFAAYQLVFKTKDGTLIVEIDGDAEVRFQNGELRIFGADGELKYTLKPSERSKTMPPGPYTIQVVGADGVKLETAEFTMTKNGAKVRVTLDQAELAKDNPKALFGPKNELALDFNGIDSLVEIATLHPPADGPVTVELWANPKSMLANGTMLEITGDNRMLKLHHVEHLWMGDSWNAEKSALDFHETPATAPERWSHVALCWDGKTQTLFMDGVIIATALKPYPCPRPESRPALLGCMTFGVGTYSEFFRGSITEVRVSKSIRYKESFTPQARFIADNDTIALYHFDEGDGKILKDSSPNKHDGKIIGAKWVNSDGSAIGPKSSPPALPAGDSPPDKAAFPGKLVFYETFDDPKLSLPVLGELPAIGDGPVRTIIQNGMYRTTIPDGKGVRRTYLTIPQEPVESPAGAFAIRVRVDKSTFWLNFRQRQQGDRNWWLLLNLDADGRWQITSRESRTVKGKLEFSPAIATLADSGRAMPELAGQWVNVAGRWSETDYELFLNGKRVAGGPVADPAAAVATVRPAGVKFGMRMDRDGPAAFELDYAAVWSQAGSLDSDRKAAEYVLSIGGAVQVNGANIAITNASDLPKTAFTLTLVSLKENKKVSDAGLAVFKDCKNLETLHLNGTRVTDSGLVHFKDCKKLAALNLSHSKVTDAGLAHFKDCENLTYLHLGRTQVSDVGLTNFKNCKNLTKLNVAYTEVSNAGLTNFKNCKNLTGLELSGTRVNDAGMAIFKDCKELSTLFLAGTFTSDAGLAQFRDCKNLTHLILQKTRVTAAKIDELKKALPQCKIEWDGGVIEPMGSPDRKAAEYVLSIGGIVQINGEGRYRKAAAELPSESFRLTTIYLDANRQINDEGLAQFKECKNLTSLRLADTKVTDAGLAHFKDCKSLTLLQLHNTQTGDAGLANFNECTTLTYLNLQNTTVSDVGLANFKDCKNLTVLNLAYTQVTDAGLANFKECKDLINLNLDCKQVSDTGLANFKDCKNLTHLNLGNTQLSDGGLAYFRDCKNLTELHLGGTQVSDSGVAHFKDCKNLKSLDLQGTKITDVGLAHFQVCKSLTVLALGETQVTDAGVAFFKDCKSLTVLDLRTTKVSDAGLAYFKDCEGLTQLNLSSTQVSDSGLTNFKNCKGLTWLAVDGTHVSDAGLANFKDCKSLTNLYLAYTHVNDAGLGHFKDCKSLTVLWLNNSQVSDAGLANFKDYKSLTTLTLQKTRVTAAKIDELKKALPQCKIEWDGGVIEPKK